MLSLALSTALASALAAAAAPITLASPMSAGQRDRGTVLTLSNDPQDNQILIGGYLQGEWYSAGSVSTGGRGTGAGLGSQGALVRSPDRRHVLAVNPGSDEVSLLGRWGRSLRLLDLAGTGGVRPTSVTVHQDLVYVLNAGSDDLAGFRIDRGRLMPLGLTPLSGAGVAAAQVGFDPSGRHLVVSERATDQLLVFPVQRDGSLGAPTINPSAAPTPFGFLFRRDGTLVVSEAVGGQAGASVASSYEIDRQGGLRVLDPAVATLQSAACWIAIPRDGRFAYTTNTASGTLSGFRLDRRGDLELLDSDGVTGTLPAGAAPIDFDFGRSGRLLFVLDAANDQVVGLRRNGRGGLQLLPGGWDLPDGAAGMIAD